MMFKIKFAFLSVSKTFQNQSFDFTDLTFLGQLFEYPWGTLLISGKLFKTVTHFSKITIF